MDADSLMTHFCLRFRGTAPSAGDAGHGGNDDLSHQPLGPTIGFWFKSSPLRRPKTTAVRGFGFVSFFSVFDVNCVGAACFDVAGRYTGLRDHALRTG